MKNDKMLPRLFLAHGIVEVTVNWLNQRSPMLKVKNDAFPLVLQRFERY